jgi:hypothetical protein
MKLRTIALALTITFASVAAHAQSGVYVAFETQQFTQDGIYANPATDAGGNHGNIDRPWLFGPAFGVYYDITHLPYFGALKTGPVVVGIDARGDIFRLSEYGSQLDREDGIFSLRVATKRKFMGTTPYVQGGFGIGHTKIPFATHYSNNLVYQFGLGVDRKIRGRLDWRVIEATAGFLGGYQAGYANSGTIYGPGSTCGTDPVTGLPSLACTSNPSSANSNYLVTLGTGLVWRFR